MTQIHISIRKPKTGGLDPVTGTLRFRPVRRHFDAAKESYYRGLVRRGPVRKRRADG